MIVCSCDFDPPEFYRAEVVTSSRKPFRCEECRRPVPAGERYERVTGKWCGFVDTFKTCCNCLDLRVWMKNNVPCFCFSHGNLFDDVLETCMSAEAQAPDEVGNIREIAQGRIDQIMRAALNPTTPPSTVPEDQQAGRPA